MRSFQDYDGGGEKREGEGNTAEELTRKIIDAYQGKSRADALKEILRQAEEGKKNGTLTNAEIDAFYTAFAPMLNGLQKKKLQEIVDALKAK